VERTDGMGLSAPDDGVTPHLMDGLDVRIIRAMGFRPYESRPRDPNVLRPPHVARRTRASVNTVKDRIARMEATGVIAGYQIFPNLRHLELAASAFYFRVGEEEDKDRVVAEVERLGGLMEVHDFLGTGICADFAYRDEAELGTKLAVLARLARDRRPLRFYDRDLPRVGRALGGLDWRILRALRGNPKRPLHEVAKELGVATRTVKRRHDRMAKEGSFFVVPIIDPSRAHGLFLFELLFYLAPGAGRDAMAGILKAFDAQAVYGYVPSSAELGSFDLVLVGRSLSDVEGLRRAGAGLPGVQRVEAWFFRGFHDHSRWLDDALEERIRAASA
jgi:DNA-binding Lrp family transcriptional regulator